MDLVLSLIFFFNSIVLCLDEMILFISILNNNKKNNDMKKISYSFLPLNERGT
jgi:hypothetical protein